MATPRFTLVLFAVFAGAALLLIAIGVVASVVPALRAARADPLVRLRGGS